MKTKRVNRYNCDYCGKRGYSVGHMKTHEKRCTLNLARECRMCYWVDEDEINFDSPVARVADEWRMERLMSLLPDPKTYLKIEKVGHAFGNSVFESWPGLTEAIVESLPSVREAAGGCPVCVLSALRLKETPMHQVEGVNCKDECEKVFAEIRNRWDRADCGG